MTTPSSGQQKVAPAAPQVITRHPGARTSGLTPNLVQIINRLRADVAKLRTRALPTSLTFTTAGATTGVACTSATFVDTHTVKVVRAGDLLVVELLVGTGVSSVMEARLSVPDLALTSAAVLSAAGGEQQIKLSLALPAVWLPGDGHLVNVQARRASGTDATTVRVIRSVHR